MAAAGTVFQKRKGIQDSPESHFEDIMRISDRTADRDMARLWADNAGEMLNWLADNGLTIADDQPVKGTLYDDYSVARYHWGAQNGRSILAVLKPQFDKRVQEGTASKSAHGRGRRRRDQGLGRGDNRGRDRGQHRQAVGHAWPEHRYHHWRLCRQFDHVRESPRGAAVPQSRIPGEPGHGTVAGPRPPGATCAVPTTTSATTDPLRRATRPHRRPTPTCRSMPGVASRGSLREFARRNASCGKTIRA